jgi:hypothetical protein
LTIKKILDIISSIKKFLYNQFKIGGDAMQPETLARFFLECIVVTLISTGFIFEDKIITMERKLLKKIIGGFKK